MTYTARQDRITALQRKHAPRLRYTLEIAWRVLVVLLALSAFVMVALP